MHSSLLKNSLGKVWSFTSPTYSRQPLDLVLEHQLEVVARGGLPRVEGRRPKEVPVQPRAVVGQEEGGLVRAEGVARDADADAK